MCCFNIIVNKHKPYFIEMPIKRWILRRPFKILRHCHIIPTAKLLVTIILFVENWNSSTDWKFIHIRRDCTNFKRSCSILKQCPQPSASSLLVRFSIFHLLQLHIRKNEVLITIGEFVERTKLKSFQSWSSFGNKNYFLSWIIERSN